VLLICNDRQGYFPFVSISMLFTACNLKTLRWLGIGLKTNWGLTWHLLHCPTDKDKGEFFCLFSLELKQLALTQQRQNAALVSERTTWLHPALVSVSG